MPTRSKKKGRKDPQAAREAERYEHPIPSRVFILDTLETEGVPLDLDALADALGVSRSRDRNALKHRLRAMVRDGQLLRNRRDEYCLVDKIPVLTGTVSAHRDGFGFVVLDAGGDDVYLSPRQMRPVFHRDRVAVRIAGHDRQGRPEGKLVEVLDRATSEIAGRYVREADVGFVVPENPRITHEIVVPAGKAKGARPGQMVTAEIIEAPSAHTPPIGQIIEILGDVTRPGMETDVAIRSFGLPHRWPDDVATELEAFGEQVPAQAKSGRVDLRDVPLVTIDGADAKDFDDAVFCEPDGKGFRLLVAIADVSHYVAPGSALDDEAQKRGTSVYFPNRVIPMLPEALSNGLCSLNPEVDRLCMVCDMRIGPTGKISRTEFSRAVMRSAARLTYAEVNALLWRGDKKLRKRHAALLPHLENLSGVYRILLKLRRRRGAVDLDIPSNRFEFDQDGRVAGVVRVQRHDAHRLIEECMIAANVEAARFLLENKLPALFRNHASPSEEKSDMLRAYLGTLGMSLQKVRKPAPADYQKIAESIAGRDDARVIGMMILRAMMQAEYAPKNEGHFGLALSEYAHFTSPIRRYPDLLVHRAIGHAIADRKKRYRYSAKEMTGLGRHCSMTERRAEEATRDVDKWLKCEYMLDHVGDEFEGTVVAITEFGLFLEIDEMNVEGLVHVTSLGHDYFKMDPRRHLLVGRRTGLQYKLMQKLTVRVAGVNIEDRKIDFELVERRDKKSKKSKKSKKNKKKEKRRG